MPEHAVIDNRRHHPGAIGGLDRAQAGGSGRPFRRGLQASVVVAAVFAAAAPYAAASDTHRPLRVDAASVSQDGNLIAWSVRLDQAFSATSLAREGRSLCLLLERERSATATGRLCVTRPLHGQRVPRLLYVPITAAGPQPARAVAATVTRASPRQLTGTFLPASIGLSYRWLRWQVLSTLRPPGCVPASPNPSGCFVLFPARSVLVRLHTPQLVGCLRSGPPVVSHGGLNRPLIALTFDDGPWPDTPQFLRVLERYHAPATFFEIGRQIATYDPRGAIERRMLADGDMIGNHTWSHPNLSGGGSFAAGQIVMTASAVRAATGGFTPCLFRAPYGAISQPLTSVARSLGYTTIQWDVDPRDWSRPGTGAIYQNVIGHAHNGAIVIQHDGGGDRSQTLAALPREIETLRRDGYRLVTITDLLNQQLTYK